MPDTEAPEAQAPAPEAAPEQDSATLEAAPAIDPRADRIAEIVRSHLRDTALSRTDGAWNTLQSKLPAIAADILKEL